MWKLQVDVVIMCLQMYDTGAAKPLSYATPTLVQGHPYPGMMVS